LIPDTQEEKNLMAFYQRKFLVARLKAARQPLESLLPKTPTDKEIYAGWTIKELLAHMSGWDDVIIEALRAHARGEPVSPTVSTGINAYNARIVSTREGLSLEHVIQEWRATRQALLRALKDLPDEKFNLALTFPWGETGTVAYLIEIFIEHEEDHGKHLAAWLKNPDEFIGGH
jgi:hypothetical protein